MPSIRKTKTASGSTAVQVVYYKNRKLIIEKHIGSGKSNQEIESLVKKGKEWIRKHSKQEELFPENSVDKVTTTELRLLGVSHSFTYELLLRVAGHCGLDSNKDRFLLDFAIMRLIEPASKLRTIKLLECYFDIIYSERTVYRKILNLGNRKQSIEQTAIKCAKEMLQEDLALILYDVTTLYFETFKGDELRIEGFSKDNKPQQPQIVVGLIVTRQGFPLGYEIFSGNTFEGKTMLKVLDDFTKKNQVKRPIIVADAAMLSKENIEELKKRNLSYIVGARLGNTSVKIIETAHDKLLPKQCIPKGKNGKSIRIKTVTMAKNDLASRPVFHHKQEAVKNERCLFTFNVKDFVILHKKIIESSKDHRGIIAFSYQWSAIRWQAEFIFIECMLRPTRQATMWIRRN